jgi:hypothetical protein
MSRLLILLALGSCVVFPLASQGKAPALPPRAAETGLPVGKWNVEFANGVTQVCEIAKDGTASVAEPLRNSGGKAVVKGSSVVIVYEDDRVERWTPVGKRLVVEHWFPASQLPTATPVLGIAEPVQ